MYPLPRVRKIYSSIPENVVDAATMLRGGGYRVAFLFLDAFSVTNKERLWGPPCLLCNGYL